MFRHNDNKTSWDDESESSIFELYIMLWTFLFHKFHLLCICIGVGNWYCDDRMVLCVTYNLHKRTHPFRSKIYIYAYHLYTMSKQWDAGVSVSNKYCKRRKFEIKTFSRNFQTSLYKRFELIQWTRKLKCMTLLLTETFSLRLGHQTITFIYSNATVIYMRDLALKLFFGVFI